MGKEPGEDRSAMMGLDDEDGRKGVRVVKAPQVETIEKSPLKKFDDMEKIRKELTKREPPAIQKLFRLFRNDPDLRNYFIAVFVNPVSRHADLRLEEEIEDENIGTYIGSFRNRHKQAYNKRDELKSLGLIEFLFIHDIILKEAGKEKLTANEKTALKKFKEYCKLMTKKKRLEQESKINYYVLSETGMNKELLNFIVNLKDED